MPDPPVSGAEPRIKCLFPYPFSFLNSFVHLRSELMDLKGQFCGVFRGKNSSKSGLTGGALIGD